MPFKNGTWHIPTEKDLEVFKKNLKPENNKIVNMPKEAIKALVNQVESTDKVESSNIDLFRAMSKIQGGVDIVIPVYGGLHVLKSCVDSILERTNWPFQLYLVDDTSPDPEVRRWMEAAAANNPKINVTFNKKNRGFAATVNRGIKQGFNPYVIVLNSDVIVTEAWLTKILIGLEADPRNQIANPVTNNTALINVNMYPGKSYLDMDTALNRIKEVKYPETMPTGFCLAMKRKVFEECGPLDEAYGSYGEESDFWFKTIRATDENGKLKGYRAVLIDNCYVFHERGTSFSQLGDTAHMKQRRAGSERFHKLHPEFGEWHKGYDTDGAVGHLRTMIPPAAFNKKYKGNVAWLVKSASPCGGMNFITDIVNQLIEEGYNAQICLIKDNEQQQPTLVTSNLHTSPVVFNDPNKFLEAFKVNCFTDGIVFSAVTELSNAAKALQDTYPRIKAYNHVQSWDVGLAKLVNREDMLPQIKKGYLTLPNVVSSEWVAKEIKAIGGNVIGVHVPGVNPDLFHVREREKGDDRFTVGILMDSMYSYKGYTEGVEFCKKLTEKFKGRELRILAIAADSVPECPNVIGMGHLSQSAMALLMSNEIDVFVDPARIHSYGLPTLEALFSGCAAVTFNNKGETEYSNRFKDRLYVNSDIDKCVDWVGNYIPARCRAKPLERLGYTDEFKNLSRQLKVKEFIQSIFPDKKTDFKANIEVVTPHMRKHGGPTTIITMANQLINAGHNVGMSMVYTDWNPEVINMTKAPVRTDWVNVPKETEVVIINSDNPFAAKIMGNNPDKKYIMYKLSHNERFKQIENDNLNLPWDHIVTSTSWLRDVCIKPKEGWTHQAWPEDKVSIIGWYHYGHETFNMPPQHKNYGTGSSGFRIGTLIHNHPLKGSSEAVASIEGLKKKYGAMMQAVGLGEDKARLNPHWQYIRSAPRKEIAHVIKQLDIWLGASHTEGLGRLALEAMSAGVAVVTTNTGAEFLKHGENCLLYDIGNPQQGAELVDHLVNNEKLFQKLVINGYKTAIENADPTQFVNKLNTAIKETLNV